MTRPRALPRLPQGNGNIGETPLSLPPLPKGGTAERNGAKGGYEVLKANRISPFRMMAVLPIDKLIPRCYNKNTVIRHNLQHNMRPRKSAGGYSDEY